MNIINCNVCSKETKNKKYCSRECQYQGLKIKTAEYVKCVCKNCEIEFEIRKSSIKYGHGKYCSKSCSDNAKKINFLGENNPMYGKILSNKHKKIISKSTIKMWKNLEHRKNFSKKYKEFKIKNGFAPGWDLISRKKRIETTLKHYNIEHNWNGKYGFRDCDLTFIKKFGITSVEYASEILNKMKKTDIEIIIENILIKNNIKYKFQYLFVDRYFDFYLEDYNILVEADGDFWHAKDISDKKLLECQIRTKKNDKHKNNLVENDNSNIKLVRFWGSEILTQNFEEKLKKIWQK